MKILITGCCGFIGYHTCVKLLSLNHSIIGVDNFNDYYDPIVKYNRFKSLKGKIQLFKCDLQDPNFYEYIPKVDLIIHLAAQAGVRYSLIDPDSYVNTNILGFFELLKYAKKINCEKIIYASSASVYGSNPLPWNEDMILKPISLYGATKASSEAIADSYYHMFGIKSIGLRFFSVYGPWGRPDLSLWKWTEAILKGNPVILYNYGNSKRSWTFIDDIIDGIISVIDKDYTNVKFNLGNEHMINIDNTVDIISDYLNIKPIKDYQPLPDGDISEACPDLKKSKEQLGFEPKVKFEDGIKKFVDWFREYKGF